MAGLTAITSSKDKDAGQGKERSLCPAPATQITKCSPQASILGLQHAAGNLAVSQVLKSSALRAPSTLNGVPPIVQSVLTSGGGLPLEPAVRDSMESRFGQDFSQVRVHIDARAAQSARVVDAVAYTYGHDVVLRSVWRGKVCPRKYSRAESPGPRVGARGATGARRRRSVFPATREGT